VTYDGSAVTALGGNANLGTAQIGRVLIGETNAGRTYDVAIDDVDAATSRSSDTSPPLAPTDLNATPVGSAEIALAWTAALDDLGVASYTIYRSSGGSPFSAVGSTSTTSFHDTGLAADTTYDYVVDAVDGGGNHSPPSDPASAHTAARPPNVVVILSDDQPWDTLGRMATVQSELVARGTSFPASVVTDPLCCPSRTSTLRGQYDHTTGIYDIKLPLGGAGLVDQLGLEASMLPTWLDAAGYRTGLVGKYLNSLDLSHVPEGWDYWRASSPGYFNYKVSEQGVVRTYGSADANYNTRVLTGYADAFVRTTDPNTPLFLWLAPNAPHSPYTPDPRYANDARCTGATNLDEPSFNEADVSDKPAYVRATPPMSAADITEKGTTRPRKQCRMLLSVDDMVGTVLQALRDTGRLGDTLIVYTSDNGFQHGEHRQTGKESPYESSIRVPLVIRYDPITGGVPTARPELVANIDIAPTIVDLLDLSVVPGCPSPPYGGVCGGGFDGTSLLPLLDGSASSWRDGVLIEHVPSGTSVPAFCELRTRTDVFVRYTTGEEELYDLAVDPAQLVNLLGDGSVTPSDQATRDDRFSRLFAVGGLCSPAPPAYVLP
jgi:arylsulfatase A-like enzyme